jgi:hypothetical protein
MIYHPTQPTTPVIVEPITPALVEDLSHGQRPAARAARLARAASPAEDPSVGAQYAFSLCHLLNRAQGKSEGRFSQSEGISTRGAAGQRIVLQDFEHHMRIGRPAGRSQHLALCLAAWRGVEVRLGRRGRRCCRGCCRRGDRSAGWRQDRSGSGRGSWRRCRGGHRLRHELRQEAAGGGRQARTRRGNCRRDPRTSRKNRRVRSEAQQRQGLGEGPHEMLN